VPFAELAAAVAAEVAAGRAEEWVDTATGLHVYSYFITGADSQSADSSPSHGAPTIGGVPAASVCRGLVLHPATRAVVAAPFLRFGGVAGDACVEVRDDVAASASLEVDGSLVVAFLWGGQLQACTRRRMDSEPVSGSAV
jgi:hypothetical protein